MPSTCIPVRSSFSHENHVMQLQGSIVHPRTYNAYKWPAMKVIFI